MVHLVYSVQALLSSDYFKNNGNDKLKEDLEKKSKTTQINEQVNNPFI